MIPILPCAHKSDAGRCATCSAKLRKADKVAEAGARADVKMEEFRAKGLEALWLRRSRRKGGQ